jgi:hypothetical protein
MIKPRVEPVAQVQTCCRCKESKPATPEFWVRNRPNFSRGRELPRTYHRTCRKCESAAKVAAWARRHAEDVEWRGIREAELRTQESKVAAEAELVRARNAAIEAENQRIREHNELVAVGDDVRKAIYKTRKFRPLGEDT